MMMLTVIIRFPYRLIPKLPPAKLLANVVGVSSDFIDERRKGLVRWLTITTSHPVIKAVWSTLIGRDPTLLRFHWSRASLVMLVPAILCHKEPARASKAPYLGIKSFYARKGPLCHKEPARSKAWLSLVVASMC